jgi:hypothetical protein
LYFVKEIRTEFGLNHETTRFIEIMVVRLSVGSIADVDDDFGGPTAQGIAEEDNRLR